jgi:hypothetical protein
MKLCHVVSIVLNAYLGPTSTGMIHRSHGPDELPRPEYLRSRIPLLYQYALRSLVQQTTSDFHVVVLYDLRLDVRPYLPAIGTSPLEGRLHFVGVDPIDFKRNLEGAFWIPRPAEDAKIIEIGGDAEQLLITYVDSDDCYRADALVRMRLEAMAEWPPLATSDRSHFGSIMCEHGLIHHVDTGVLAAYHERSTPFYSLHYDMARYRDGVRYHGGPGHHSYVRDRIPGRVIRDRDMFMVNVHGANDSTNWSRAAGPELRGPDARRMLADFGVRSAHLPA